MVYLLSLTTKLAWSGGNVYSGLNEKGQELVEATNARKAARTEKAGGDEALGRVVETAEQSYKHRKVKQSKLLKLILKA